MTGEQDHATMDSHAHTYWQAHPHGHSHEHDNIIEHYDHHAKEAGHDGLPNRHTHFHIHWHSHGPTEEA